MARLGEANYRRGALERLEEAFLLLRRERFGGAKCGRVLCGLFIGDQAVRRVMAKQTTLTKERLGRILNERLALKDPEYHLEKVGGRLVGHVVSRTFRGKRDDARQTLIWNALEAELGPDAARLVGMLLAYTPEEWNIGADGQQTTGRGKKAG
jgi:acid stress-induced BolA-like protein IbaG/YrbA